MGSPSGLTGASLSRFATLVEEHTSALVERWDRGFREGAPPYSARLQAQLRQVLRALSLCLQHGKMAVPDTSSGPFVFDLQSLVNEYGLLSSTLLELAEKTSTPVTLAEQRVFCAFMSALVADGVASFTRLQTQPLLPVVMLEGAQQRSAAEDKGRAEFERQLLGVVAHDLGNPIAAMSLGVGLLMRHADLDPGSRKVVGRLKTALDGMMRQVNDLLDFSEARAGGGLSIARELMNLHGVTQHAAEEVQMTFPARELEVEHEGDGEGSWDPQRIAQVAQNLISNALKHSPADTTVRVKTRADGEWVELSVSNQGRPIAPEVLPVLFEPMQRGAASTGPLGHSVGLGLYVVKHIVDALGGTIRVTSNAAAGTAFTLRFPRVTA